MKHLTDAQLRTQLDGELDGAAATHLQTCPACQAQLAILSTRSARVAATLSSLAPAPGETPRSARAAFNRFKHTYPHKEPSLMTSLFAKRLRPAFAVVAIVLALGIALTFAPVQALATSFLGLFRVNQIQVVQIDSTRLSDLTGNSVLGERIGKIMSDSFTITKEASDPIVVADASAASAAAGFTVRLPTSRASAPTLTVQDGSAFEFVINREQAQGILNEAGFSDLQLPESVDGAPINVTVPSSVAAAYGNCPKPGNHSTDGDGPSQDLSEIRDCVIFTQVPSPTVDAPAELDIKGLAEVGLQFMGMTPEEALQLSNSVDWATTLVIPIPSNAADVQDVSVDGVTGTLLTRSDEDFSGYTLIWVKDGIIYAVTGLGDSSDAIDIANSLQ